MTTSLEKMVQGYLECALFSTHNWTEEEQENPNTFEDDNYDVSDFSEAARAKATEDCKAFWESAVNLLTEDERRGSVRCSWEEYFGHNFWLTREGHGAGFWDGSYENGKELTALCKPWGNASDSMNVNDSGEIEL